MNPKRGKPPTITDDQLKKILYTYIEENSGNGLITPSSLEQFTEYVLRNKISRFIWMRRMQAEIDKLNYRSMNTEFDETDALPMINFRDVVEKYWGNKDKLIREMESYEILFQKLFGKAAERDRVSRNYEKLKDKIAKLEEEVTYLRKQESYYKNKYFNIVAEGTYEDKRNTKGLKNVIDIDKNKKKAMSIDWKNDYKDIF